MNKGVKQEYKQFWDADLGVTYIPWEKVKVDDLDGFAEGGIIDQETVNDGIMTHFFFLVLFSRFGSSFYLKLHIMKAQLFYEALCEILFTGFIEKKIKTNN